eukprot:723852-Alexandrium_andersonii.AAC.1
MSASLVGSEMCIRDRAGGWLWVVPLLPAAGSGANGPNDSPPVGRGWPVSYTHLTLPTICSV